MFVIYILNFGLKERLNGREGPKKGAGYGKQVCTRFCYRKMTGVAMAGTLSC